MKRGHVTGEKRERTGASEWYRTIEEENIQRVEAEWAARNAAQHGQENDEGRGQAHRGYKR